MIKKQKSKLRTERPSSKWVINDFLKEDFEEEDEDDEEDEMLMRSVVRGILALDKQARPRGDAG